jgi:hypothetical protein
VLSSKKSDVSSSAERIVILTVAERLKMVVMAREDNKDKKNNIFTVQLRLICGAIHQ